jgi:hypothetical protein
MGDHRRGQRYVAVPRHQAHQTHRGFLREAPLAAACRRPGRRGGAVRGTVPIWALWYVRAWVETPYMDDAGNRDGRLGGFGTRPTAAHETQPGGVVNGLRTTRPPRSWPSERSSVSRTAHPSRRAAATISASRNEKPYRS